MKTKLNAFALLLALLVLLTGCAASAPMDSVTSAESAAMDNGYAYDEPAAAPMEPVYEEAVKAEMDFTMSTTAGSAPSGDAAVSATPSFAEKIIYSGRATIETVDYDYTIRSLEEYVKECGGFIERSNSGGNTRRQSDGTTALVDRWADYTVRVPAAQFDEFMSVTGWIGNVIESGRSAENVTSQYTDYEARLKSLTIQEERLLVMLEQSGELESLIALEERLSEVRYEIESIERSLRDLDQRLAYSDVSLYIYEVEVYTPTVTVQRTFGEKLSDAFSDGWVSFTRGLQRFVINLAEALPTLVLWIIIIVVVILVLRKILRRRKVKKTAKSVDAPAVIDTEEKK